MIGAIALALCGCHNPVFDDEGDCEVTYGLRFVYEKNLDWADAFPTLVNRVDLYAFDSNGVFVKEYQLTGAEVFQPGYTMTLDLQPGDYTLVAWAALETGVTLENGFNIPQMTKGVSTLNDLTCTVKTESNAEYSAYSNLRLPFLYNGNLSVNLPDSQDGADYYYTMYLTKDTNHVRAMVQKIGSDITAEEVEVVITAPDETMAWNNELIGNNDVTYLAWDIQNDELGEAGNEGTENIYTGVVADLMTGRFTDKMLNSAYLSVINTETEELMFKVPVVQYALMGKQYYETAYGKMMTDQEYLDRQSEYVMTFFVDKGLNLQYTVLDVLSWRVVIRNYDVGD